MGKLLPVAVALVAITPIRASASGHVPKELVETFAAEWNAHNVEGMARLFEPDGDIVYPYASYRTGQRDISALLSREHAGHMRNSKYELAKGDPVVRMLEPKYAIVDWEATITGITDLPNQPHRLTVILTRLAVAKKEGKAHPRIWSIIGYRIMLPAPRPEARARD